MVVAFASMRRVVDEDRCSALRDGHAVLGEMLQVMYAAKGVGLAAPQVGVNKRLMVFNPGRW